MELFPQHFGFEIKRADCGGFYLIDRDTFNNWGDIRKDSPFATAADAAEHAGKCDRFKRGRSMSID